jgi:hypothetical protein
MAKMRGSKKFFDDGLKKFLGPSLLFIAGNVLAAVVGYLLSGVIVPSIFLAVGALLLAGLTIGMQVLFALHQNNLLEAYARQIGGVNRIICEPDLDIRDTEYSCCESGYVGICYETLAYYLDQATESIFVIPNPFREGGIASWESKQREQHLRRIETAVAQKKGLYYTRIQQVPRDAADPWAHFGPLARDHILRLGDRYGSRVQLRYLKSDETSGFMVIDGRLLVKYMTGVNSMGQRNLIALALQETPSCLELRRFCEKLTKNFVHQSMPIPMPAPSAAKS